MYHSIHIIQSSLRGTAGEIEIDIVNCSKVIFFLPYTYPQNQKKIIYHFQRIRSMFKALTQSKKEDKRDQKRNNGKR